MTQPIARGRLDGEPADLYVDGREPYYGTGEPTIVVEVALPGHRSGTLGRLALAPTEARALASALTMTCDALAQEV